MYHETHEAGTYDFRSLILLGFFANRRFAAKEVRINFSFKYTEYIIS